MPCCVGSLPCCIGGPGDLELGLSALDFWPGGLALESSAVDLDFGVRDPGLVLVRWILPLVILLFLLAWSCPGGWVRWILTLARRSSALVR